MATSTAAEGGHSPDLEMNHSKESHLANDSVASFSWENLEVQVKDRATRAPLSILSQSSGFVRPGEMLAIMGPSGSGKTTLLNALAHRIAAAGATTTGDILVNGQPANLALIRDLSAYVEQEDSLIGSLTVKETMVFAARLALPRYVVGSPSFSLFADRFVARCQRRKHCNVSTTSSAASAFTRSSTPLSAQPSRRDSVAAKRSDLESQAVSSQIPRSFFSTSLRAVSTLHSAMKSAATSNPLDDETMQVPGTHSQHKWKSNASNSSSLLPLYINHPRLPFDNSTTSVFSPAAKLAITDQSLARPLTFPPLGTQFLPKPMRPSSIST